MIVKPVLIVGAPRSGTSLLQSILRNHPAFWSLPSESDLIWDRYCHPSRLNWESECMPEERLTPDDRDAILDLFESYARPAGYWEPFERAGLVWGFRRWPRVRRVMRKGFSALFPLLGGRKSRAREIRLLEKTASNCFRLGYVDAVFPGARIIYPTRDGRNNVNSLINAWQHPSRFFTYDVPARLAIRDCPHQRWKFVLPPGWRDYTNRSLAEVCAFQWRSCHEAMLAETGKDRYRGRVMQLKLEELTENPASVLARLAEFLELPYDDYFQELAAELPVVNSPDNDTSSDKWLGPNRRAIEAVMPMIMPTMRRLGYED